MNFEDIDKQILEGYIDDLIKGTKTTITVITESPQGTTTRKSIKRTTNPKERLEYLRMRHPEDWKIPQPQPMVSIQQNTIEVGLESLKQLLIPCTN